MAVDFFRYLTPARKEDSWSLVVTAAGSHQSVPGAAYPPPGHPVDHGFSWDGGRVLGAYQIVHLRSGAGSFESAPTGLRRLSAGDVLLLFPNIWHRYRPDPKIGWHEQWIELRGPLLPRLESAGLFKPGDPVVSLPDEGAISALFHRILDAVRSGGPRPDPLAGAWAMEILARLHGARRHANPPPPIALAISRAEAALSEQAADPPSLRQLAQQVGFGYSYFRREFKAATGVSPGQYVRRLRLERARRLLGTTADTVKAIADELGFSSEFHFSTAFKRQFGISPAHWRARARRR